MAPNILLIENDPSDAKISHCIETFDRLWQVSGTTRRAGLHAEGEPLQSFGAQSTAQHVERAAHAHALFEQNELAQMTLDSIGDAILSSDDRGNITYLNRVAERMTGWSREEAMGRQLEQVFRIVDAATREAVPNPLVLAIRKDEIVRLSSNCVLVARDGVETAIEDSAAPIHDRLGLVCGAVMVFRDVSAARALSLRTSHMARHDSLTDLPNKATFNDRLAQAIALARRHRQQLAVLFLDLDHFKHINDSMGHAVGDRLLQCVAKRLRACVRGSDTVSRQGGDEFVVLLSEVKHPRDAALIADKIRFALSTPYRIDLHDLRLTVSIGIVTYPHDGTDGETLTRNADVAMYWAKDGGSNNHRFFKPDMNMNVLGSHSIASARSGRATGIQVVAGTSRKRP